MSFPDTSITCVANLFTRQMVFNKAGDKEDGHKHCFDHTTLLTNGSLKVIVEGKESVFKAPFMIYIHKDKQHELIALEDNTIAYCIHALRDGENAEDIIDPKAVPDGVHFNELIQKGIVKPLTKFD